MDVLEEILTPSYHGELCRHNGENPDYEIACDECDFFLVCFPEWEKGEAEHHRSDPESADSPVSCVLPETGLPKGFTF